MISIGSSTLNILRQNFKRQPQYYYYHTKKIQRQWLGTIPNNANHYYDDQKNFRRKQSSSSNNKRKLTLNEQMFINHNMRSFCSSPTNDGNNVKNKDDQTLKEKADKLMKSDNAEKAREASSKLKYFISKYGATFVGTYFSIWCVTLSSFYGAIESGMLDPASITTFWGSGSQEEVDSVKMVAQLLAKWELTAEYADKVEQNPHFVTLGLSILGTKIVEPFRIGAAVYITPKVAKIFGKK